MKHALSVTRQQNFAAWYQEVISEADLAELYNIRLISCYNDELESEEDKYFNDRESIILQSPSIILWAGGS